MKKETGHQRGWDRRTPRKFQSHDILVSNTEHGAKGVIVIRTEHKRGGEVGRWVGSSWAGILKIKGKMSSAAVKGSETSRMGANSAVERPRAALRATQTWRSAVSCAD